MPRTVTLTSGTLYRVTSYETGVLVLGALLVVGALVSGLAGRSFLSLTALFVVAGFVLGDGGLDVARLRSARGLRRATWPSPRWS